MILTFNHLSSSILWVTGFLTILAVECDGINGACGVRSPYWIPWEIIPSYKGLEVRIIRTKAHLQVCFQSQFTEALKIIQPSFPVSALQPPFLPQSCGILTIFWLEKKPIRVDFFFERMINNHFHLVGCNLWRQH